MAAVLRRTRTWYGRLPSVPCAGLGSGGVQEIWCALSDRADGTHVRDRLRGILFAARFA
jgi:hypothetical protein